MKVLVAIKRVMDYNVPVQVKPDASGIAAEGAKMIINPFDEIALEEALRLREKGQAEEVVVVSVGSLESQQQLRTALAMGADRAVLVETNAEMQPLGTARALLKVVAQEQPSLVLLGKQAIDDDAAQTGQMLAALWDRPQATFASEVLILQGRARVTREIDAGQEILEVDLPAVITADLRLNEPRFVKLPDMIKAKRKTLEILPLTELAMENGNQLRYLRYSSPPPRPNKTMVQDVPALLQAMKDRGAMG